MENLKIWIVHYTPLKERKEFLEKELQERKLNYEFIELYDKECLPDFYLNKFNLDSHHFKNLGTVSLFIKYMHTLSLVKDSEFEYNLVFEDDVIVAKNFTSDLKKIIQQLPNNFDMVFLGNGCNLHIPDHLIKQDKLVYKKSRKCTTWGGMGATRCMDSVLISKKCCINALDLFNTHGNNNNKLSIPLDWWFNEIIRIKKFDVYWAEPTIVKQGSETGKYAHSH